MSPAPVDRTLLVLGGGEDQLPAYLEGRRLGCRVVGVDQRAGALAAEVADEFLAVSTRDPEAIAARLGDREVAGVIASATDAAHATWRELADRYGTPFCPSAEAARASTDKGWFRDTVRRLGLPGYGHAQHADPAELLAAGERIGFPLVVKPSDSSGSKGMALARDAGELRAAIAGARRHAFSGEVIVEELVEGRHYTAECFADDGALRFVAVSARTVTGPPGFITVSHLVPADLDAATAARVAGMLQAVCDELKIDHGPANFDLVVDAAGEVRLIEMGARLGGNGMPRLIQQAFGVNLARAAVQVALGDLPDLEPRWERAALLHVLHSDRAGTLVGVSGRDLLDGVPQLVDLGIFVATGSHVEPYVKAANKLGYLGLVGDNPAEVRAALQRVLATLRFEVAADDPDPQGA